MAYLRNHPKIHQELTLLVRQGQPTDRGLPIEIYCFTNDTDWLVYEDVQADVLILETTRGSTETPAGFSRDDEAKRLIAAIRTGLERRAGVLVPVFALGRTQEVLGEIALAMQRGELKRQPVYIGGLGRVFTEIYDLVSSRAPNRHPDLNLHEALDLQVLEKNELEKIKPDGRLFVITAGMMSEHTLAHELALRMAPVEKHAILFVGYAAPETPAGKLRAAATHP